MAKLFTERELARDLGVSVSTVRKWRASARGPRFAKLAGAVRYREPDVQAWLESRVTGGDTSGVTNQVAALVA